MYRVRGYVKVIATGITGRVEDWHEISRKYWVEFDRDFSTRQWFTESELVGVSSTLFFLRYHSTKLFHAPARCISLVFPPRMWYRAALRISLLQAVILRPVIALSPYRNDRRRHIIASWLLNSWLRQLSTVGRPFSIPIQTKGEKALFDACSNPNGAVICSVHLPLVHLVLRSLVELNRPSAVVAGKTEMRNRRIPVWGLERELPGIVSGSTVLLKVQRELRTGGLVFALLDTDLGDSLRPNMFRLIQMAEAQVVFAIPELLPNGEVLVEYFAPPDPFCTSEESILSNIRALQCRLDAIFQHPSAPAQFS
jgi:hypothetical protein